MVSEARFKKTEIGMLPYDWKVTNIKSVADKKQEHSFIDGDWIEAKYIENQGIRLIQTGNIGIGHFIDKESKKYISEKTFKELNCKEVKPGDILICRLASPIGRACIAPDLGTKAITAVDVVILKVDEKEYSREYINYYLNFGKTLQRMESLSSGSTRQRISRTNLGNVLIAIPPLSEQRKIAAILSSVDEAIEKTEAIIEQTEKVKKGLMQQLLTKGIGHTKFKKTEIGEIPEEWEVRRLEEVTLPKEGIRRGPFGGALKKEIFVNEGYAVYEQQHVINNNMREFRYFIDEKKFLEMKQFEVIPGDILISCSGTVGKVALVPENAKKGIINQALLRLRLKNKLLSNLYAWYLFSSDFMQSKMTDMSHGSTLKNIVGMTELRKISIPIPPLDEQMEIVSILTSVDQMHQNELERLSQLQNIKKGLMQSLLTGKVRVKVDDEVVSS